MYYGCKNIYTDPRKHSMRCKLAVEIVGARLHLQIRKWTKNSPPREDMKRGKVDEKRAKVAKAEERLEAREAQHEVCG